MSGLEAIGIAAGLIQIADLGANLSIRLFTFYRQMKTVNKSVQNLSSDVALTSTIMRQLAENLRRDEQEEEKARVCSREAFQTAEEILGQCRGVFGEIEKTIERSESESGKRCWRDFIGKAKNVLLLEPDFNVLMDNLERLKSSMLLLLNVIMYAGQVRSKSEQVVVHEQRGLIQRLLDENRTDEGGHASTEPMDVDQQPGAPETTATNTGNAGYEIKNYNALIKKLLSEVDARRLLLENSRYMRIKDGMLNIHSGEVMRFQISNGCSIAELDHSLFEAHSDSLRRGDTIDSSNRVPFDRSTHMTAQHCSYSVEPTSHYGYGAEKPPFPEAKSPDSNARSPSPMAQFVNYDPDVPEPPPFLQRDGPPNGDDTKGPAGKNTSPEHKRVPDDTTLGDSELLNHLAPTQPEISSYAKEHPLEAESREHKPRAPMMADFALHLLREDPKKPKRPLPRCIPSNALKYESAPSSGNHQKPTSFQSAQGGRSHNSSVQSNGSFTTGFYKCHYPGCTVPPFQSQYLLNSHTNMHSQGRPFFCTVEGCARSVGGKGFKRRNEMTRHRLVHDSPGYVCPFCPDQQHKYPRPDNLMRVHHIDKSTHDPALRAVLAQRPKINARGRRRRANLNLSPESGDVQRHDASKAVPGFSKSDDSQSVRDTGLSALRSSPTNRWEALLLKWTTLRADEISDPFALQPG